MGKSVLSRKEQNSLANTHISQWGNVSLADGDIETIIELKARQFKRTPTLSYLLIGLVVCGITLVNASPVINVISILAMIGAWLTHDIGTAKHNDAMQEEVNFLNDVLQAISDLCDAPEE